MISQSCVKVKTKSGKKFHRGRVGKTIDGLLVVYPDCNQTSTGWHKEPRADEVTCRKCLRIEAKLFAEGIQPLLDQMKLEAEEKPDW